MDEDEPVEPVEKYELYFWVASGGQPDWRYSEEHWFVDRPDSEITALLLEQARLMYAALFPESEPKEISVAIRRLRTADNFRPDFKRLLG